MKVINYNYGYNNTFNCCIHGKVRMSGAEWIEVRKYLLKASTLKKAAIANEHWTSTSFRLRNDLNRTIETNKTVLFNIRVPLTELLAKKYGLNIKRANYAIEIIK